MAKQDFDAKKAAYDTDVATVQQRQAALNQAKAQTASARGHGQPAVASSGNSDQLGLTESRAPFDGIVTNVPVREGETVVVGIQNAEGSTLMTLADMSVITAEVKVDETDIVNVKIGQPADVTVDAIPGKIFKGHVTLVGDQALLRSTGVATSQSTTGTEEAKDFKVVVTLDNPPDDLRPGLSTTAKITTAQQAQRPLAAHPGSRRARPPPPRTRSTRTTARSPTVAPPRPPRSQPTPRASTSSTRMARQAARPLRPRHHRHHRRHRHRSTQRPQGRRRDRHRPLQSPAHPEERHRRQTRHTRRSTSTTDT